MCCAESDLLLSRTVQVSWDVTELEVSSRWSPLPGKTETPFETDQRTDHPSASTHVTVPLLTAPSTLQVLKLSKTRTHSHWNSTSSFVKSPQHGQDLPTISHQSRQHSSRYRSLERFATPTLNRNLTVSVRHENGVIHRGRRGQQHDAHRE